MATHQIGTQGDFPERKGVKVDIDGIEIAVINVDGELYGIQNRCPHKNLPLHVVGHDRYYSPELLDEGYHDMPEEEKVPDEDIRGGIDEETLTIKCPWHQLNWNLETGENEVKGVCIATYDVEVRDDDTVWVEI